ncbi:C40 family peptidase [Aquibaculum sediminis]|uniref:C40 family peptidase n=1 Tax=Aquibaculum sediminis TaxID=3231907 RepID=UPI00345126D8
MTDAPLDPRNYVYRADLADARLRGRVEAQRFTEGSPATLCVGCADLKRTPSAQASNDSQLLFGERLRVFDRKDGWAWVQNDGDGYVGWVRESALGPLRTAPDHRVAALRTPQLPEPNVKAPPLDLLPFASVLRVTHYSGPYAEIEGGGWVFVAHLVQSDKADSDYIATAWRFLGLPYLWGGRSSLGLDCSALVQLALGAAGLALPRDSDQQETCEAAGRQLPPDAPRQRGDLLYWPGHVALALDAERVLHATGGPMLVVEEPFAAINARVQAESGRGLRCIRRP